ncbi:MAG TPA: superoxide dismutase, Ni [Patescibacteria group bacterium]|nr:superoxide dismutase, Ni [Patescibacteria group bacterium]
MHKFVDFLAKLLKEEIAYAHCDIPCGIYDPFRAQQAAHTIIRMTELLGKIDRTDEIKAEHDVARCTRVKEKHGDIVEEELGTLQNDYFKEEHFKEYPTLSDLLNKTVKSSILARQSISMEAAEQTLSGVLEIAEIFFKTKKLTPVRIKSVYPTEREMVLYK